MDRHFRRIAATAFTAATFFAATGGAQEILTPFDEQSVGEKTVDVRVPGAVTLRYSLDGRAANTARVSDARASFRIDLGSIPLSHTLTLTALDVHGAVLGERSTLINPGGSSAYLTILEPAARSALEPTARALVCAHLQPNDVLSTMTLTRGNTTIPLLQVRDERCDGVALAATIPDTETAPYVEATAITAQGKTLSAGMPLGSDVSGFSESITVRELQCLVRPVDRSGATVPDVPGNAFRVVEDRRELSVREVLPVANAPIRLAIVPDASMSTYGDTAIEEAVVRSIRAALDLETVVDQKKDSVIVYAIGSRPIPLLSSWSSDSEKIEDALRRAIRLQPSQGTAAYDTLEDVLYQFQSTGAPSLTSAGAILYLTDGSDSLANTHPSFASRRRDEVLRYARSLGVQVYVFDVQLPVDITPNGTLAFNAVNNEYLDALVQQTGGERISIRLEQNPAAFLRHAERLAAHRKHLLEEQTEQSLLDAKRVEARMNQYTSEYSRQIELAQKLLAQKLPSPTQRISDAIDRISSLLRSQYVVTFTPTEDGKPRERRLEFPVDDPRVVAVKAPVGARY